MQGGCSNARLRAIYGRPPAGTCARAFSQWTLARPIQARASGSLAGFVKLNAVLFHFLSEKYISLLSYYKLNIVREFD